MFRAGMSSSDVLAMDFDMIGRLFDRYVDWLERSRPAKSA
jgi:hypothetical protein